MMQRWARHWLRTCREMPLRGRRLLERFDRNPEKRIHDFRRVMKAWRSLLKLAPAAIANEAKAVRAEIKQLRQSFGAARDAIVVAKTLNEVLPKSLNGTQPPAAAPKPSPQELDAVCTKLDRLAAEMEGWSVAAEGGGFLLTAFKRSYRKARRRAGQGPGQMPVKRLHAWRTAIIDLGYQLVFFQPADPAAFAPQAGAADRLRSHLGTVVDLDMARTHLAGLLPPRRRARAEEEIDRSIAKQRNEAARIAGTLLDERPKRLCAHLAESMTSREPRRIKLV
jgi:CHAD domain-containing protein